MKKFISLLLLIFMLFITGCSGKTNTNGDNDPNDSDNIILTEEQKSEYYNQAKKAAEENNLLLANYYFWQIPNYKDSIDYIKKISPEIHKTSNLYLNKNGDLLFGNSETESWKNLSDFTCSNGQLFWVGLKDDGTLMVYGDDTSTYTMEKFKSSKKEFKDIIQCTLADNVIALKADGSVVTISDNSFSLSNNRNDILAINAATDVSLSFLTQDGSVYVDLRLPFEKSKKVFDNCIMTAISESGLVFGLTTEGKVLVDYTHAIAYDAYSFVKKEVSEWDDIIGIYTCAYDSFGVIGVKKDGSVVYSCYLDFEIASEQDKENVQNVKEIISDWKDVVFASVIHYEVILGIDKNGNFLMANIGHDSFKKYEKITDAKVPSIK